MARAYNPVGRAREARLQNIGLTCKRELARNLQRSEPSRLRDKRVWQVEAVVRSMQLLPSVSFPLILQVLFLVSSSIPIPWFQFSENYFLFFFGPTSIKHGKHGRYGRGSEGREIRGERASFLSPDFPSFTLSWSFRLPLFYFGPKNNQ